MAGRQDRPAQLLRDLRMKPVAGGVSPGSIRRGAHANCFSVLHIALAHRSISITGMPRDVLTLVQDKSRVYLKLIILHAYDVARCHFQLLAFGPSISAATPSGFGGERTAAI